MSLLPGQPLSPNIWGSLFNLGVDALKKKLNPNPPIINIPSLPGAGAKNPEQKIPGWVWVALPVLFLLFSKKR